jgi:hypothetical protein
MEIVEEEKEPTIVPKIVAAAVILERHPRFVQPKEVLLLRLVLPIPAARLGVVRVATKVELIIAVMATAPEEQTELAMLEGILA